ncbi:reverse transcriptase domain-containing protein [Actinomadura oligospora]|uniref:reverse transcriptase domain-containing protein n=1 Tax=Actinomadura oligospora TaxID=111804 RepID=UPI001474BF54|nr:reverse transcriptase domain-containing protein [Actinomadura oligospora]
MPISPDVLRRLDLGEAVKRELSTRVRLLPRRWDYLGLVAQADEVASWLRPQLRRSPSGRAASVVFADKGWRGVRPLHIMTLEDRVLYRAIVNLISESLPERLRTRAPIDQFRKAPLEVSNVEYIAKTDVTSYYEFVDHELLMSELIAQTGEALLIDTLSTLLASVLGRYVGLPQVHPSSDILGDTYIDPVRRRLIRRGHAVFTYSDDFRIASSSLGEARASLEACEMEVRTLGLVLNERKTYTYGKQNYSKSLTSFADAEQRLFAADNDAEAINFLGFLETDYEEDDESALSAALSAASLSGRVDEIDAFQVDDEASPDVDSSKLQAAERAWNLWLFEDESEDAQAAQTAAITQSLLGRALPTLGAAGDGRPLMNLSALLRLEPALTPQVAAYLDAFSQSGGHARTNVRQALDEVVNSDIISAWQGMWLAQVAGGVKRSVQEHGYEQWLSRCVYDSHDGLAATAAAALGRIGRGDAARVAAAVNRIAPEWRRLAFWGLIGLDRSMAEDTADDQLDHLLLSVTDAS